MNDILDILGDGRQDSHGGGLCDYCPEQAAYLTEYGLLCDKHVGFVRLWRKTWA